MASIRVQVWLEALGIDKSIKDEITLTLTSENQSVSSTIPLSQPLSLALHHISSNIRASFTIEDTEIASGYLALPESAQFSASHTYKDHLISTLKNVNVSSTKFSAEFAVEISNESPAEQQYEQQQGDPIQLHNTTSFGNTWQNSTLGKSKGDTSPLRDRVNPHHPTKQDRTFKYKEEELHGYLTRIVERHI